MTLPLGSKLGSYEVLSLLGAGGMGEVYRARDTRLGREVAIKVLPAERMADENRRRRFVQEARAASALNHPNIVTIYEIESADGDDFIVMEYVPGRTLDTAIPRQGMRLGEVLRIAIPIADAVARAHAAGIVHRDLKPANVVVGSDGAVKVLDFGLAKLVAEEEADSPKRETRSEDGDAGPLSRPGTVAGTVEYMSPEQATGNKVDARSDVFSFGAMLYEMVTGRRAFAGNSRAETVAAVLREQPKAPSEVVPRVPRDLEKVILRCLQKEPDRRFQHMGDVRVGLQEIKEESESQPAAAQAPVQRRRRWRLAAALAGALLLAVPVAVWLRWRPREIELSPPRLVTLTSMRGLVTQPTFSPDGDQIAFTCEGEKGDNWDIYLKMIGSSEIHRLTTDSAPDFAPSWSPDGRQIAFVRSQPRDVPWYQKGQGTIHLISPVGGSDRKLSDFPVRWALSWSPDGRWLAAGRYPSATEAEPGAAGIYLIPVLGGESHPMTSAKAPACHFNPALSPDGHHLAYASCASCDMEISCHVDLVELGADYVPAGPPRRLTRRAGWIVGLAWTRDGNSLIYGDYATRRLWRAWIVGDRRPEKIEFAGPNAFAPATAASLDRLAFGHGRGADAIYRFEMGHPTAPPEALLESSLLDGTPHLSPDGRRVTFESTRGGEGNEIWLAAADGSSPMQLTHGPGIWQGTPRWSPDGQRIAFDSQAEDGTWDIWTIDAEGGSPRRLTLDPGNENMPSWSRDGHWIYFQSDRTGAQEIWRIPSTGGSEERVTHGGGNSAYESADGKTLFFTRTLDANASLFALPLAGGPERKVLECLSRFGFAVGPGGIYHLGCTADLRAVPLYLLDPATGRDRFLGTLENAVFGLTVSPDGKTILYTKRETQGSDLMMIENFR